ncbi:MAG: DUF302 domain-containing protein [Gammaproteobacteria bacterium]
MYAMTMVLNHPYSQVIDMVNEQLAEEKFGVVSDINVQAVLKKKLDVEYPGYRILGACKPGIAKQIADAEPDAGVLLPCSILVRENNDGTTTVAFMDPVTVLGLCDNTEVNKLAEEAKAELLRVMQRLENLN